MRISLLWLITALVLGLSYSATTQQRFTIEWSGLVGQDRAVHILKDNELNKCVWIFESRSAVDHKFVEAATSQPWPCTNQQQAELVP